MKRFPKCGVEGRLSDAGGVDDEGKEGGSYFQAYQKVSRVA